MDHESRKRKKWTKEEDRLLREAYKISNNVNDLMNSVVGRYACGIKCRLSRLANLETIDKHGSKWTQNEIETMIEMHNEEILNYKEIGFKLNRTATAVEDKLIGLKHNLRKEVKQVSKLNFFE